ncbi:uncharacterized protein LOC124820454 [Vigna umbellata]|uniref:uncharacterized protein LOC124820454 n=1 Tax=Vigna umbellata TaxID=87088 RepID=UPI001F5F297A|nr:uncharacterized protein LOC124820454 [Vigna umbellata]
MRLSLWQADLREHGVLAQGLLAYTRHDCETFVKKCISGQAHGHDIHAPPEDLHKLSLLGRSQWGLDIVGPLPIAKAAKTSSYSCGRLLHKMDRGRAVVHYQCPTSAEIYLAPHLSVRSPQKIITDNVAIHRTQSSNPQTNGQAEAANKAILTELKKDLVKPKVYGGRATRGSVGIQMHPHGSTGDTPFNLTYGTDAMLPSRWATLIEASSH